ncbi:MAG TPA: tyrosinase family protein [Thermoanaerobaculia bacterium]|jgi:hypothetical protein
MSTFAQTPVRLSWQEFAKDPARLQSYRNAVAAMKALNTADPASVQFRQSWTYWANMHGYFGPQAKNGTVAAFRKQYEMDGKEYDAAFAGVVDMTPPDAVATAVWDQCQHGTDYFFPWHRLYLHYFEQVLQKAAGDPSLRLPYWDYTDTANLAMPAEFTSPTYTNAQGQVVDNPLYEARRDKGWNVPPGTEKLAAKDTNIDQTLDLTQLLNTVVNGKVTVKGYQPAIEQRPHGYAHCAVMGCKATVMGAVAYSANDPIFYIHHANIDRLWDCWMSIKGHVNPGAPWTAQSFSYVDANGTQVSNKISDLFKPGFIDYVYQQPSNCKRTKAAPMATTAAAPARARAAHAALATPLLLGEETADLALDAPLVRRRVTLPATATLAHPREFALRDQEEVAVAIDLTLRGVQFGKHPNAEFRVYLERTDNSQARQFVGTLSFFSQEAVGTAHAHHHHVVTSDDWTFDVTEELRALRLEGTGTLAVNVIVEVEEDDLEEFDPAAARVVIDEIEFHVRRDL